MKDTDCVKIYQLPQKPELIKVVAPYLLREWPIAFADWDMNTAEEIVEDYVLCCSKLDAKPMTLIATRLKDGVEQCCGVVTIEDEDMRLRPEFTPWLTNLYVLPAHRGLGIGKALLREALSKAKQLQLPELYLWTDTQSEWYKRYGFVPLETVSYCGHEAEIMKLKL